MRTRVEDAARTLRVSALDPEVSLPAPSVAVSEAWHPTRAAAAPAAMAAIIGSFFFFSTPKFIRVDCNGGGR